jgi:hypothetical protein
MSGYRSGATPPHFVTKPNLPGRILIGGPVQIGFPGNGYSAWNELVASLGTEHYLTSVGCFGDHASSTFSGPTLVDVGVGGSGAEVVTSTSMIVGASPAYQGSSITIWAPGGDGPLMPATRIAAGTRIAVRGKMGSGGSAGANFYVYLFGVSVTSVDNF